MPAPTKLFDVSNANGAVIGGETVVRGTLIWYKDNAAKNRVEDQFALAYGYQDTIPNPLFGQNGQPADHPESAEQGGIHEQATDAVHQRHC